MLRVDFYHKGNGECPIVEFLDSLNPKTRAKTLRSIMLLEEFGNELRMPYSEKLENGIFELRAISGSDITRVLYFFVEGNKAVLTHGFVKKTSKTPHEEIEKAYKYRSDYYSQHNSKGAQNK